MSIIVLPPPLDLMKICQATLIVPVAGEGRRFVEAGYTDPKPYIQVPGMPGTSVCALSLSCIPLEFIRHVVLIQRDSNPILDQEGYVRLMPSKWLKARRAGELEISVVTEKGPKQGAAQTVLAGLQGNIGSFTPVIVANCDQYISEVDWEPFRAFLQRINWTSARITDANPESRSGIEGVVMCFKPLGRHMPLDRWSYPVLNKEGHVEYVIEKPNTFSGENPTVGIYAFRGAGLMQAIETMIDLRRKTNGEYYLAPAYSYLRSRGRVITAMAKQMWGLGTPDDLVAFGSTPGAYVPFAPV